MPIISHGVIIKSIFFYHIVCVAFYRDGWIHIEMGKADITPLDISVGEKARLLRKSLGLNQAEVAEKIGCASNTISSLENGVRAWDNSWIYKYTELFNVPASYFYTSESIVSHPIKSAREKVWNISQETVAKAIGISVKELDEYENGIKPIPKAVMDKIKTIFRVD